MGNVCSGKQYPHDACEYNKEGVKAKLKLIRDFASAGDGSDITYNVLIIICLVLLCLLVLVAVIEAFWYGRGTGGRKMERAGGWAAGRKETMIRPFLLLRSHQDVDAEVGMWA